MLIQLFPYTVISDIYRPHVEHGLCFRNVDEQASLGGLLILCSVAWVIVIATSSSIRSNVLKYTPSLAH